MDLSDVPKSAQPRRRHPGHKYLYNRCLTIAGGTGEVQRNIMARRVLGVPR